MYPRTPGHHGEKTSVEAAQSVISAADTDRDMCFAAYQKYGPMTADECAARLGWRDIYRARRRVTELKQQGRLCDTLTERPTASGRMAAVLAEAKPKPQGEQLNLIN